MYYPLLLMSHRTELISELPEAFCGWQEGIDYLLVDTPPSNSNNSFDNTLREAEGICAAMWSAEKHDADSTFENAPKMGLA